MRVDQLKNRVDHRRKSTLFAILTNSIFTALFDYDYSINIFYIIDQFDVPLSKSEFPNWKVFFIAISRIKKARRLIWYMSPNINLTRKIFGTKLELS